MTTQTLVEVEKQHSYKCPVCDWYFREEDGEGRNKPMTGYYFDVESEWHDNAGDLFITDSKIIKGTEITTCHRVEDDCDYNFCHIDMANFEPTICKGWKCEGCNQEVWYDNERCSTHSVAHSATASETAKDHLTGHVCSCSSKPAAPAPAADPYAVGARLRINCDAPLSASLYTGDIVTVTSASVTGRVHVAKDGERNWIIEKSQGDPIGAVPAEEFKQGDKVELTVTQSDGVDYELGEVVTVLDPMPGMTYFRIIKDEKHGGRTWNLTKTNTKPYTELDPEIADKFVRKENKKKVTVLDF